MISRRSIESAEQTLDGRRLSGYAAVYNQDSREIVEHGRSFTERIAPGAFGETLAAGSDVKLYYNHDASMPLARTRSGTLKLRSDRNGLAFDATLPETTLGNDVRALIERGDLSGEMSFGFFVVEDSWNRDRSERLVKRANLVEISIVQDAAYPQTNSSLRSARAVSADVIDARLSTHYRRLIECLKQR
jgi:HK97 family phage prohead protease